MFNESSLKVSYHRAVFEVKCTGKSVPRNILQLKERTGLGTLRNIKEHGLDMQTALTSRTF
jgi:hypothetical protein